MRNLFKYMHEVIPRHLRSVSDAKLYPQFKMLTLKAYEMHRSQVMELTSQRY